MNLREEHIASRKDWGAYLDMTTMLHRETVAKVDEFVAQTRERLDRALVKPAGSRSQEQIGP